MNTSTDPVNTAAAGQTYAFQAEVKQLLQLMIHSLYSNREIFLRELISNAADACDKLRFESLDQPNLIEGGGDFKIGIAYNATQHTLTVSDNGIGMTESEAIAHLGTIAKSGTKEFFARLTGDKQKDANLIGQFGVGFYASFIVADQVTVVSRRAGQTEAVQWQSKGDGEYTISIAERAECGTDVILHLRDEHHDLLNGWKLRELVRRYSDHIVQPIVMKKEAFKDGESEQQAELETVNQASALWARPRNELTDDDYKMFYKHVAHDYEEPLAWLHARVEGRQEYTQLLYIPAHAPFDMWDRQSSHGIKLYVRRVFIMDDAERLLPMYLRFVRGVVDSADLPLNVSREILQESRDIDTIRAGCTKKVLGLLEEMVRDKPDDYTRFWEQFGQVLKEGVGEDQANRERIAGLLRFASTHTDSDVQSVSMADYISRMKPGQDKIYYVTADGFNAARNSPHLEIFRKKGIEVLLLSDRVDEWVVGHLSEFADKALVSVSKGGLDLGELQDEAEKAEQAQQDEASKELVGRIQASLGERVKAVRVTHRLTESPACLVADEHDIGANLARLLKAAGQTAPNMRPILEINPSHPVVQQLERQQGAMFDDWSAVLFDQALLAEGGTLEDPAGFVKRMNQLLLGMGAGT